MIPMLEELQDQGWERNGRTHLKWNTSPTIEAKRLMAAAAVAASFLAPDGYGCKRGVGGTVW